MTGDRARRRVRKCLRRALGPGHGDQPHLDLLDDQGERSAHEEECKGWAHHRYDLGGGHLPAQAKRLRHALYAGQVAGAAASRWQSRDIAAAGEIQHPGQRHRTRVRQPTVRARRPLARLRTCDRTRRTVADALNSARAFTAAPNLGRLGHHPEQLARVSALVSSPARASLVGALRETIGRNLRNGEERFLPKAKTA